jgi:putative ABC transport system permease protein
VQEPPVATVSDWRKQNSVFEDVALVDPSAGAGTLTGLGPAERVRTQGVGPNLFPLLGATPILGRGFDLQEVRRGNRQYVISNAFWKRRFDANPQVLGTRITMEGLPGTIVGVMPPGFSVYYARDVDVWGTLDPESARYAKRTDHSQHAIARLKLNVSMQQAQADMDMIAARLAKAYPETNRDTGVKVVAFREQLSRIGRFMHPLMGAVGFVLLIACANVANLLMARMASRQKEMTLRASLGAGRLRLIRQLLTEALLLAAVGGALGLLLTRIGIHLFRILMPGGLRGLEVTSADPRVLLFTLAISMLTGILFGLAPAVATSKVRLNDTLKIAAARRNLPSTSGMLVIAEMALAMLLLVGAGLMINSFLRLQGVNPGFDSHNVLTMEIFLQGSHYWTPGPNLLKNVSPEAGRFYQELLSRIERLSGVESVGMIGQLPTRWLEDRTFTISGLPPPAEGRRPTTGYQQVSPGLFQTLRIPLKRGRFLTNAITKLSLGL